MSTLQRKTLGLLAATMLLAAPLASAWELKWYGQSAFRITTPGGKVLLTDPFISKNPVTPAADKDLGKLGKIDLLLLTHGHGDHIGDTSKIVELTGTKVALNADMGHTLRTLGMVPKDKLVRFNKGAAIEPVAGVKISMVHAEHSSEVLFTDPETGKQQLFPGGEPAGFIIELENGYRIYFAGDTDVFGDMGYIADYYQPDLAILPIGGHFTMDPQHAAYALKRYLKTPKVIPMHYGTFPLLKGTPEQLREALGDSASKLLVMRPGQSLSFAD